MHDFQLMEGLMTSALIHTEEMRKMKVQNADNRKGNVSSNSAKMYICIRVCTKMCRFLYFIAQNFGCSGCTDIRTLHKQ